MPTLNDALAEALRHRQIYLMRYQASVKAEIGKYLDALQKAIVAKVIDIAPAEPARAIYRQQRLEKLLAAVDDLVASSYREIRTANLSEMKELAQAEALYLLQTVNAEFGRDAVKLALPASEAVGMVNSQLMGGAVLKDWWDGQSTAMQTKFAQLMRVGLVGGESDADLVSRVRGTSRLGFKDGLMEISRRSAGILVRGAASATVNSVRKKAVLDNPDVFDGIQQISVLDGRTSHTCISYAGRVWRLPDYQPVGHSLPYNGGVPRHPNCRSTEIPVIRSDLGGAPADDVGFDDFLKGKSPEVVDTLLGKGRADLYRDGKITLSDLVDQNGRPLTLDELSNTR